MNTVTILGYGNVGQALSAAFSSLSDFEVRQIYCRTPQNLEETPPFEVVSDLQKLAEADLYLLCVSDDAIEEVSNQLPFNDRLVAHTSGSMPLSILNNQKCKGVFYPLQTFTPGKQIPWAEVPFCLEADRDEDLKTLKKFCSPLSERVYELNSEQRKKLHLAAVVVNNFVNHLYYRGEELCKSHGIPFEILHPLILETAQKITEVTPYDAQTGPARRNDQKTLNSQLSQLMDTPLENLYSILTDSIIATYERKEL